MGARPRKTPAGEEQEQEQEVRPLECAAEMQEEALEWLLPNRVVRNALCILEGEKGSCKSTLSAALAACVTRGTALLGRKKLPRGKVLWLPGEEDPQVHIRPRLRIAGADLRQVTFPPRDERGIRMKPLLPEALDWFEETIARNGIILMVIDPLSSYVPSRFSLKDDQSIHEVLDPLAYLAFRTRCTILANRNLSKDRRARAIDRGLGGAAVAGVARSVLTVSRPNESETRRVLRVTRCNLVGDVLPIEFELEIIDGFAKAIKLKEVKDMAGTDEEQEDDVAERDALGDAKRLLRARLASGPVAAKIIMQEALQIQVSPRTLRTAKAELGIGSKRRLSGTEATWFWTPPAGGFPVT